MPNTEAIHTLNDLIEVSKDGEIGFRKAWEQADEPRLKDVFKAFSQSCAKAAAQLEAEVRKLGAEPKTSGSTAGALHRGWLKTRAKASDDGSAALLEEVERGEAYAVQKYEEALHKGLPGPVADVVRSQAEGARRHLEAVRALKA